jgi:hypothetical protein
MVFVARHVERCVSVDAYAVVWAQIWERLWEVNVLNDKRVFVDGVLDEIECGELNSDSWVVS